MSTIAVTTQDRPPVPPSEWAILLLLILGMAWFCFFRSQ